MLYCYVGCVGSASTRHICAWSRQPLDAAASANQCPQQTIVVQSFVSDVIRYCQSPTSHGRDKTSLVFSDNTGDIDS
ncbi:hypothetical protein E2C01_047832 [Portunus trituberculatus]|uniref:Uncharacterized protein n=1 Tax=Portunus trituberculatus TaxID=210409 RepID=A0A5B7G8J0_PORTR|nr:hypothetical protein [Portunus trituberculatus]